MYLTLSYGMNTKILQKLPISRKKAKFLFFLLNPDTMTLTCFLQHGRVEGQVLGLQ